jgi:leucyl aminopeptidase
MLASLFQNASPFDKSTKASHILVILPKLERLPKTYEIPGEETLENLFIR